jgi:DNA-binding transcriptional LysR family regulator
MAHEALASGGIVRVLPDWEFQGNYRGHAWILYPPSRFTVPKCRVLIDHLLDALAEERGKKLNASSAKPALPRARN